MLLLEDDYAARPDVRGDPTQRLRRIPSVHEDEPANGGVEAPVELGRQHGNVSRTAVHLSDAFLPAREP
jgi:hypothetical protein